MLLNGLGCLLFWWSECYFLSSSYLVVWDLSISHKLDIDTWDYFQCSVFKVPYNLLRKLLREIASRFSAFLPERFAFLRLTDDLSVIQDQKLSELGSLVNTSVYKHLCRWYFIYESVLLYFFKGFRQPPALPYRLQHSTIGRLGLNHRVRDENGCVP